MKIKTLIVPTLTLAAAMSSVLMAQQAAPTTAPATSAPAEQTTPSGLKYTVLTDSDGVVKAGDTVWVHYTGMLTDGTTFDTSIGRGPFNFVVGRGSVIKGWDEGLQGMKIGEKRKFTIPPELGYGPQGNGPKIPPNATLVFEVEVLGIKRG
jgi:FKBP-type peptidyl-prolyl cis-trans isomerase FkpA